jgi:NAD dependent epimerase/dehydratase family enzyme
MMAWALRQEVPPPVVNATAPNPVSNRDFMRTLRTVVGQPVGLPAPAFGIQLVGKTVGPDADLVLTGAFVLPQAAQDRGFSFSYPKLEPALRAIIG